MVGGGVVRLREYIFRSPPFDVGNSLLQVENNNKTNQ